MRTYAGIGSRKTPVKILTYMTQLATYFESIGYTLRSGGASGADSAFSCGCEIKTIYLPWHGFNNIQSGLNGVSTASLELASHYHPAWDKLSSGAKKLMARNMCQILGSNLDHPVDFVLCWTPDGAETSTSYTTGGTGQAIRLAIAHNIPVFNLANTDAHARLCEFLSS